MRTARRNRPGGEQPDITNYPSDQQTGQPQIIPDRPKTLAELHGSSTVSSLETLMDALRKDLQLDGRTELLSGSVVTPRVEGIGIVSGSAQLFVPARAHLSSGVTPTAGTAILIDTIDYDATGGAMDVTTNHRYNVTDAGFYFVAGQIQASCPSGDAVVAAIAINGVDRSSGTMEWPSATHTESSLTADIVQCNAGDYIQIFSNGTAGLTLSGSSAANYLTVMRVA